MAGGASSIALRVPSRPVARALLAALGEGVAAPSANRYQGLSPTTAAHVVKELGERVDLVLDGGPCDAGIESTVVDVRGAAPRVLRPGAVGLAALATIAATRTSAHHGSLATRELTCDDLGHAEAGECCLLHVVDAPSGGPLAADADGDSTGPIRAASANKDKNPTGSSVPPIPQTVAVSAPRAGAPSPSVDTRSS